MKSILCYGDSNTWGAKPMNNPGDTRRYGLHERWPGVMRDTLNEGGDDYWVVEEGLNARTTVHDDPVEGLHKNGAKFLQVALESHRPLDLVIIMLGTNDLKGRFSVSAMDIARSAMGLAETVKASPCGPDETAPKVLVVCPPPLRPLPAPFFAGSFGGGLEKSQQLSQAFVLYGDQVGCDVFDAQHFARSCDLDGIHWEADSHEGLGKALAARVRELI